MRLCTLASHIPELLPLLYDQTIVKVTSDFDIVHVK